MAAPKVLLTCRWPEAAERAAQASFDVDILGLNRPPGCAPDAFRTWLDEYDFICPTITDRLEARIFERGGFRVKALCNFGTGTNHIDLAACRKAGIRVTNTPDVLTEDTADIAIMLALMAARRGGEGERLVRGGGWQGWAPTHMLGRSLTGKTLGIVGMGRIGQTVARKAHAAFGMRILYNSRMPKDIGDLPFPAVWRSLDDLAREADVISLHVPGGAETRHLIDARGLALMRPDAVLVNTSRGDLIDEEALIAALESRATFAAGLDVFDGEPMVRTALLRLENAVLLPHLGSATRETRTAMGLRALHNLRCIAAGETAPDRVA